MPRHRELLPVFLQRIHARPEIRQFLRALVRGATEKVVQIHFPAFLYQELEIQAIAIMFPIVQPLFTDSQECGQSDIAIQSILCFYPL